MSIKDSPSGMDRIRKESASLTAKDGIGALDALYELAVKHGANPTAAAGFSHTVNGSLATLECQVHDEIRRVTVLSSNQNQSTNIETTQDTLRELESEEHTTTPGIEDLLIDEGPIFPKDREVARIGDMDRNIALRVGLDGDSDVYLSTTGEPGEGVEFCTTGSGGGKSSRTRDALIALIALMVAIEQDNAEDPDRDWWKKRNTKAE